MKNRRLANEIERAKGNEQDDVMDDVHKDIEASKKKLREGARNVYKHKFINRQVAVENGATLEEEQREDIIEKFLAHWMKKFGHIRSFTEEDYLTIIENNK
jgi:hypothetical protein